jgi:hypothetical protein
MAHLTKVLTRTVAITCLLGCYWSLPLDIKTIAQPSGSLTTTVQFNPPPLAETKRPSGRRSGAASRDDCEVPEGRPALTTLTPVTYTEATDAEIGGLDFGLPDDELVFSLTTDPLPSFWFYVPYSQEDDVLLEFIFQDANGNTLYQQQFRSQWNQPGIIQVSLPETVSPLSLEQSYQWYFLAHCTSDIAGVSPYVSGWISRVQVVPGIQRKLDTASTLEQAEIYAANGIWQDSLTLLGELYRDAPDNSELRQHWSSLLSSVDLDMLLHQPFAD